MNEKYEIEALRQALSEELRKTISLRITNIMLTEEIARLKKEPETPPES